MAWQATVGGSQSAKNDPPGHCSKSRLECDRGLAARPIVAETHEILDISQALG